MAYETGTATNMTDFCAKLYAFLTGDPATPGRDWEALVYRNTRDTALLEPFTDTRKEWVLKNTGLSEEEEVLIGIREWEYPAGSAWGLDLNCYTAWVTGSRWNDNVLSHNRALYDATWKRYTLHPMLPLTNASMAYWFFSNKQRIICVVRANGRYHSMYLGFGNRLGDPLEYPYPLVACGGLNSNLNASSTAQEMRACWDPWVGGVSYLTDCPMVVGPDNSYCTVNGWPWNGLLFCPSYRGITSDAVFISYGTIIPDYLGRQSLSPIYLILNNGTLMILDGLQRIFGTGLASEDIVIADGTQHVVFHNIGRTTITDFAVVDTGMTTTTTTTTTTQP